MCDQRVDEKFDDDQVRRLEEMHEALIRQPDRAWRTAEMPESDDECLLKLIHMCKGELPSGLDTQHQIECTQPIRNQDNTTKDSIEIDLNLPTCIGRFRLLETLGTGGFGVVVKGYDEYLNRHVAIKIPKFSSLISAATRARFVTEAKSAAALSHPTIVTVFESGQFGPVVYLASELIEGPTLEAWLKNRGKPLTSLHAAKLVSVLADAVQHAHDRGVVHRDIKPANIFLADASDSLPENRLADVVRLGDFGLARMRDSEQAHSQTGSMLGTPAYMAPEQTHSTDTSSSPAVDIWALGVVLYELLTGKSPFSRPTLLETVTAIQSRQPIDPRRHNPSIPRDLVAITLKCLEKRPASRYASAYDLQYDLQKFLTGRPVKARQITLVERTCRWCRNHPAMASATALAAAGFVISVWQWQRAEFNWRQAQSNLDQVAAQRSRAERSLDRTEVAIDRMLNEVADALKPIPRMETLRQSLLQQALSLQMELVSDRIDDPDSRFRTAQSWRRMSDIYLILGEFEQARLAIESSKRELLLVASSQIDPMQLRLEQARIAFRSARVLGKSQSWEFAETAARESISIYQQLSETRYDPSWCAEQVEAGKYLALVLEAENRLDDAVLVLLRSLELTTNQTDSDKFDLRLHRGQILNSLGVLQNRLNRPDEAEKCFLQSIDLLQQITDERPERIDLQYNIAVTAINLGNRYSRQRDHNKAIEHYDRAEAVLRDLVASFPDVVNYREMLVRAGNGLGLSQFRNGAIQIGANTLRLAIEDQQQLPEQVLQSATARMELAGLYQNLGNCLLESPQHMDEAEQAYTSAREVSIKLSQDFPDKAEYLRLASAAKGHLGLILLQKGDLTSARILLEETLNEAEQALVLAPDNRNAFSNATWQLNRLIQVLLKAGNPNDLIRVAESFANVDPESGQRSLSAAQSLASCLHSLESAHQHLMSQEVPSVASGGNSNIETSTIETQFPTISSDDKKRIRAAGSRLLARAVELGSLNARDIPKSRLEILWPAEPGE